MTLIPSGRLGGKGSCQETTIQIDPTHASLQGFMRVHRSATCRRASEGSSCVADAEVGSGTEKTK